MSLFIANGYGGVARILCNNRTKSHTYSLLPHRSSHLLNFTPSSPREPSRHFATLVISASKKFTPRTGRLDSKDKTGSSSTTTTDRKDEQEIERVDSLGQVVAQDFDDGFVVPKLPGEETDFWEGKSVGWFRVFCAVYVGFRHPFRDTDLCEAKFVPLQRAVNSYSFAGEFSSSRIGGKQKGLLVHLFASSVWMLIACGIAVATYNEGASDFKETPAYKESVQTQGLLEEPDASNPDVFESNPTEVAPSLE